LGFRRSRYPGWKKRSWPLCAGNQVYNFRIFLDTNSYIIEKGQVAVMEEGRRKIRICLMSMILAAVVIGIFYYYYNDAEAVSESAGTLIQRPGAESYVG